MQEENPRRAAIVRAGRKLRTASGRTHCHDRGAGLLRNGDGIVGRSAVADRDPQTEVAIAKCIERPGKSATRIQSRDDDVEVRRYWLQAAPPRTQNFAQCG